MQRRTIRKQLDDDCLLDGQLHPSIKLRLERVRELPVKCVANLRGVERDTSGAAHLAWEFIPGTALADIDSADWIKLSREVILAVQSLHSAGIVHGAIHSRNVIVDTAGDVRFTHVSPLLYTDPDNDAADVVAMLDALVSEREPNSGLSALLAEASGQLPTLEQLYTKLAAMDAPHAVESPSEQEPRRRIRLIVAAVLVALSGLAISLAVYWRLTADESQPYSPPAARSLVP